MKTRFKTSTEEKIKIESFLSKKISSCSLMNNKNFLNNQNYTTSQLVMGKINNNIDKFERNFTINLYSIFILFLGIFSLSFLFQKNNITLKIFGTLIFLIFPVLLFLSLFKKAYFLKRRERIYRILFDKNIKILNKKKNKIITEFKNQI